MRGRPDMENEALDSFWTAPLGRDRFPAAREPHPESRAAADLTLDGGLPAQEPQEGLHDRQPQPHPSRAMARS